MKEITREQMKEWRDEIANDPQSIDMLSELTDKINKFFTPPEPKKFEVWKPNDGEIAYTVATASKREYIELVFDSTNEMHSQMYELGVIFPTIKATLNHVAHLKAKKKLQDELAIMNAEANGGVEFNKNLAEYWLHWNGGALESDGCFVNELPLHQSIYNKYDYQTTIGTLTEEEVRLAFGVFE